ncbi:DNA polymerase, partial [Elysia marginata]
TELGDDDLSGIDFDNDQDFPQDGMVEVKMEVEESKAPLISEEQLTVGWENVGAAEGQSSSDVQVDSSQLPLVTDSAGDQVLRLYWLDAFEDAFKHPGVVYLFGKVYVESAKSYVSCCVTVKDIERRIFILPRVKRINLKTNQELSEDVTMPMVHEEFSKIAEKSKIDQFRAMKVKKKYAFEMMDVPVEADYLEIRYSADMPNLSSDLKGETFSHVFGTKTSSLELLLLNRKMKGPAWLDLKCPQVSTAATSWCKLEAVISKPEHVSVSDVHLPPPPLTVMTLNLQTLPNPKTKQNEIVAAACLLHTGFHMDKPAPKQSFQQHFCVITKPSDCIFPFDFKDKAKKQAKRFTVDIMPNERALLGFLLAKIHRFDPDLLVGHDIYGFDLDVLLHRISANKIPHWSKISRLKRNVMPKLGHGHGRSSFAEKTAVCGRMMCDVQISARELIRCRSYDLTVLTSDVLKLNRIEVDYDEVKAMYQSSTELLKLVELTLQDSSYILRIMYELNVIPLALQITSICGNVMSRTLLSGRSERNEWLLLHAFHEKQYICPDKEFKKKQAPAILDEDNEELDQGGGKKTQGRRKPAYSGGLVLEPKKGFYDTFILLLDFNSLYPSIIQEYNICFTTISRSETANQMGDEDDEANLILPDPDLEPGVLPVEIRKLVDSRKQILMKTKDLVQGMNLDVIYGDTDSIMINTNSTDLDTVFKLGNKVKSEVNKLYRLLEIDIDGVFKSMLLLKKKKYAALSISRSADGKISQTEERKGLDIVRRDWCDLAKNAGSFVVSTILSGKTREVTLEEIHTKLQEVGEQVREGKIPQELFYITKQLTKTPKDYPDSKSLPHVQVAMRYNSKGGKEMRAGDTVPYIICEDGSTMSATQRAYHPEELAKQANLKIDTKYYLAHQIHPVVSRLCDPIDGTDSARIAECLGLDPSGYRHSVRAEEEEEEDLVTVQLTIEERFRDCERFVFNCPAPTCGRQVVLDAPFTGNDTSLTPALFSCSNQACRYPLWEAKTRLKNMLQRKIQQHVNKYYQGWLKCEDIACGARTNRMPLIMQRGRPVCPACNRGYLHPEVSGTSSLALTDPEMHIFRCRL